VLEGGGGDAGEVGNAVAESQGRSGIPVGEEQEQKPTRSDGVRAASASRKSRRRAVLALSSVDWRSRESHRPNHGVPVTSYYPAGASLRSQQRFCNVLSTGSAWAQFI
jgi:hypothetical protein